MSDYPPDWSEISHRAKDRAAWRCIRCGTHHAPANGYTLTVHHLDGDKGNCADWNLAALCQRCHLRIQGRIDPDQVFMFPQYHSDWLRPLLYRRWAATGKRP